jgi:alpha-tubulin suppressor-like RCC1 family protein
MKAAQLVSWGLLVATLLGPSVLAQAQEGERPVDAVAEVGAGGAYTCVRWASGRVSCWGWIDPGRPGTPTPPALTGPADIAGMTDAVQLATGSTHACARRRDGTVACWGSNTRGQLGDGTTTDSAAPVSVVGLADVVHVAAGANVSCAVVASGAAYCWGSNALGGLGDGSTTDRSRPVAVTGVSDAAEVALGGGQTCVRRTTGAVVCWGDAGAGGFGDGSTETARRTAPGAAVAALAGAERIAAGSMYACATTGGAVRCWGGNFGMPATPERWARSATAIRGLTRLTDIALGEYNACALTAAGTVSCWGGGSDGVLGNGTESGSARPRRVSGVRGATDISVGRAHACALLGNGSVTCWGTFRDPSGATFTVSTPHVVIEAP